MPSARLTRFYVCLVAAAGGGALGLMVVHSRSWPTAHELWPFLTLILGVMLGETFPVRGGAGTGEIAYSSTFTFALLLGWGPGPAVTAQVGACLLAAVIYRARPIRVVFNVAQYSLAVSAAAVVLVLTRTGTVVERFDALTLLEVTSAAAAFFAVNTVLVAGVVAIDGGVSLRQQVIAELRTLAGTEGILLGMAPLALIGVQASPILMVLIGLPLLAVQRAGRQAVENEQIALRDALTGLANRVLLTDRAAQAVARARRDNAAVAVMMIDLNGFKEINDTLGHHVGDQVLCAVGRRIGGELREGDTVARLGGDEFAVLLPDLRDPDEAREVALRIASAMARPLEVAGVVLEPGGSVGVACHPEHGDAVDTLLRHADAAMYTAKADRSAVAVHASGSDEQRLAQLRLAGQLSTAVAAGEIVLHYQPQVRPATGELIGVEALARWAHPHLGLLPPDRFIPLAERSGHIAALTRRVLTDATAQLAAWRQGGLDLTLAINLSAASLTDSELPEMVAAACARAGVPPDRLVLEITEGMLLARPEQAIEVADRLAVLGVGISVDDFGTGHSSLEQLVKLPAAELKIDRSFVTEVLDDPRAAAIVRCVADLGRGLNLRVVAEGVETEAHREAIERVGCHLAQGFLWSRPLEPGAVVAFARASAQRADEVVEVFHQVA